MHAKRQLILFALVVAALSPSLARGGDEEATWLSQAQSMMDQNVPPALRVKENCSALGWLWDDSAKVCSPATSSIATEFTCAMMGGKMQNNVCRFDAYATGPLSGATWVQDLDYNDTMKVFANSASSSDPLNPLSGACNTHYLVMAQARATINSAPRTENQIENQLDANIDNQINCNRQIAVFRARSLCLQSGQQWVWYKTPKGGIYEGFCTAKVPSPIRCCVEQWEAATPYCPPCDQYDMTRQNDGLPPVVSRRSGGGERNPFDLTDVFLGRTNTLPYDAQDVNLVSSAWAAAALGVTVAGGGCAVDVRLPDQALRNQPFEYAWASVQTSSCSISINGSVINSNAPVAGSLSASSPTPGAMTIQVRCKQASSSNYCSDTKTVNVL